MKTEEGLGRCIWAIAGGLIPRESTGREPEFVSADTLCFLNTGPRDALLRLTFYYPDAPPVGPYRLVVKARRTRHVRVNDLIDPQAVPLGREYGCVVESGEPIVVQISRQDTSRAVQTIAGTLAWPDPASLSFW